METKLNSLTLIFYWISLEHPCTCTSILGKNHMMKSKDKGKIFAKELFQCHKNSSISPFLKPSFLSHEVSYEELKGYDMKTTKDHSTITVGVTSCIRRLKTS
ncbi:hypothetical protein M9H77_31691 [Catharanthus roseus]|uniref:Uncharacterized protein n=1 Tax=Catharanthus roseus TaxID=4058 RepID=A0ACC0A156_CATRO|nr:hypothetical protein M9H77_31691 [Catharanthus roseus]